MAKRPDPNLEMENSMDEDMDPFAIEDEGAQGSDPFDFNASSGANPSFAPPIKKESASVAVGGSGARSETRSMGLTSDVPVQLVAVLGKKTLTIKEILSLKKGQVLELNRFPNEAIDLVANGKLMAKGELVEIDGKLGIRVIKIFE